MLIDKVDKNLLLTVEFQQILMTSLLKLSNGESFNYFEQGLENINKKPTLIFIHGNMSNWMWWIETMNVLKQYDYHMIAVDLRGFGQSSYNNPCSNFGDWAGDLVDFCNIKNIKECIAIGHSFGGGVSMKLAELAPELVKKIILTSSISHQGFLIFTEEEIPCKTMQQIKGHPQVKFMEQIIKTQNKQFFIKLFEQFLLANGKDFPLERRLELITEALKQRSYADLILAVANSDINLHLVKAKGLMIHGKEDIVVLLDTLKSTADYFKNISVWENHGHMLIIEDIPRYAEEVRKFVQEQ